VTGAGGLRHDVSGPCTDLLSLILRAGESHRSEETATAIANCDRQLRAIGYAYLVGTQNDTAARLLGKENAVTA
jgi:hypothetical protein